MNEFLNIYSTDNLVTFSKILFNGITRYENVGAYSEGDYIYVHTKSGKVVIYPKSSLTLAVPIVR